MFADIAKIYIRSGKGGDGHISFRREKYVPNGGPDGGDGGLGGDVIFVVDEGLNTLTDFRHVRKYKAEDGVPGGKKNCRGKDGEDIIIRVPVITRVNDSEENMLALAKFLREKTSITRVELLPYHKLGLEKMTALGMPAVVFETPSEAKMNELNTLLTREGIMTVSFK